MTGAQCFAHARRIGFVGFSPPESLLSNLEFALRANARKTGDVSAGHAESLSEHRAVCKSRYDSSSEMFSSLYEPRS
jgi:hypothetical protein